MEDRDLMLLVLGCLVGWPLGKLAFYLYLEYQERKRLKRLHKKWKESE